MKQPSSTVSLVISYLGLRKALGVIGTALPFVLALGKILLFGPGIQTSISAYYHTGMRDVFVGAICALAAFLISYKGYERKDDLAGHLAGASAITLSLFPVAPDGTASFEAKIVGAIHVVAAGLFFLTLAYFSLVLFRKTHPNRPPTPRKLMRNRVYTVCGYIILVSIGLIVAVYPFRTEGAIGSVKPIFWLEALAVVAFGVSWLTKGEAILQDE